ncbi:MAG: terminase small subunit, partial [Terriglobales bacterium]
RDSDLLSARETAFVHHYQGNAREAALKAGYSPISADRTAQFLLGRPSIRTALKRKQEAALAVIEQSSRDISQALLAEGITPQAIAKKLKEVLDCPPHRTRGWADHISALKLVTELMGFAAEKDEPARDAPEISEDGLFYVYRPKWR